MPKNKLTAEQYSESYFALNRLIDDFLRHHGGTTARSVTAKQLVEWARKGAKQVQ